MRALAGSVAGGAGVRAQCTSEVGVHELHSDENDDDDVVNLHVIGTAPSEPSIMAAGPAHAAAAAAAEDDSAELDEALAAIDEAEAAEKRTVDGALAHAAAESQGTLPPPGDVDLAGEVWKFKEACRTGKGLEGVRRLLIVGRVMEARAKLSRDFAELQSRLREMTPAAIAAGIVPASAARGFGSAGAAGGWGGGGSRYTLPPASGGGGVPMDMATPTRGPTLHPVAFTHTNAATTIPDAYAPAIVQAYGIPAVRHSGVTAPQPPSGK